MPDDQKLRGLARIIDTQTDDLRTSLDSFAEWETVTTSDGATAETSDGDDLSVLEPYGFASTPPGTAQTIAIAPGADDENRVALGLSSVTGRPATDAGDAVTWTAAGHSFLLDDDGGILLTSKDGSTIDLPATGAINITAGTGANITLNVDPGSFVDAGGALKLALGQATIDAIDAFLAGGVPVVNDGGANLKATMITTFAGVKASILAAITRGA